MQQQNIRTDDFSSRLKSQMAKKQITQSELATELMVSQGTVSGWLNGAKPQKRAIKALSDFFHVPSEWFITGKGPASLPGIVADVDVATAVPAIISSDDLAGKLRQIAALLSECADIISSGGQK